MQTPSGGFGYWPGGTEPVAWGTAYATHMLLDAQKLKYPVPQDRLDDAISLAGQRAQPQGGRRQGDDHDGSRRGLHALRAGHGRQGPQGARPEAHRRAGPEEDAQRRGPRGASTSSRPRSTWPATAATRRTSEPGPVARHRRAPQLLVLLLGPPPPRPHAAAPSRISSATIPRARRWRSRWPQSLIGHTSSWYTTQELVWSITGLGKRVSGAASSFTPPVLDGGRQGGGAADNEAARRRAPRTARGRWPAPASARASRSTLRTRARASSTSSSTARACAPAATCKTGGDGLAISRTYRKLDGSEVSPGDCREPRGPPLRGGGAQEHQPASASRTSPWWTGCPAGWEIENARLGRGGTVEWMDAEQLWTADYVEHPG